MYIIYQIKVENIVRYIGITNNLARRQSQHRLGLKNNTNSKLLYNNLNHFHKGFIINLETIKTFSTKGEAARYEALLILQDHFGPKQLWQSPPRSIKYF